MRAGALQRTSEGFLQKDLLNSQIWDALLAATARLFEPRRTTDMSRAIAAQRLGETQVWTIRGGTSLLHLPPKCKDDNLTAAFVDIVPCVAMGADARRRVILENKVPLVNANVVATRLGCGGQGTSRYSGQRWR